MKRGYQRATDSASHSLPVIRSISVGEWRARVDECSCLPIAADPGWGAALHAAYGERFRARAWSASYADGEDLVVGYENATAKFPRLTLSPLGMSCGVAARGRLPRYQSTLTAFTRSLRWRYRSITYALPFWATAAPARGSTLMGTATTHALALTRTYDDLFRTRFAGKTRTRIRCAERERVRVVVTREQHLVTAYRDLYEEVMARKGFAERHQQARLLEAAVLQGARGELAIALVEGRVVAGGLFLEDGPSIFYGLGAMDRSASRLQPNYALLSDRIRWALDRGKREFNFGGSIGIRSLEAFKETWGATPHDCDEYIHWHPLAGFGAAMYHRIRQG